MKVDVSPMNTYMYVEIGPSIASPGQQRRKNATGQIRNITYAGIRIQAIRLSRRRSTELRCHPVVIELSFS